ncbi:MAG: hypothetical protein HYR95_02565 [Candidatus Colwellbacteria bacterium]|nr:hypothetical protein [Candidatus Colwellbacteria bacterium]
MDLEMKIMVIKIGSSVLLTQRNKLDEFRLAHIAGQIIALKEKGVGVILVISGAVACGAKFVGFSLNSSELRRVAAGIGQVYLISVIQEIFSKKNLQIAQLLLVKDSLAPGVQKEKISELIKHYLQIGIVPIINENDVLELNGFGGNDFLAAELAMALRAEQLLMLSTMARSAYGVGGGESKQEVLRILNKEKVHATIVDGKLENIILKSLTPASFDKNGDIC